jgi:hypothetical protein
MPPEFIDQRLFERLLKADVRFVVIGVGGANYYALPRQQIFLTEDKDLLLPLDPANTLACWQAAESVGFKLWLHNEPLGRPMDLWLAERIVERRMVVTGLADPDYKVDLTYTMGGFGFEEVWSSKRIFAVEGVDIPVASLRQIVESKRQAGRKKDLLFFATHEELLRQLLTKEDDEVGCAILHSFAEQ